MLVIGHRGAPAEARENTFASFDAALEAGADGLEMDLRLTADGAIVICHDDSLDRVWGAAGRVSTSEAREMAALGLPTVEEVLERYAGRTRLYLECKGIFEPGLFVSAEPVARALVPLLGDMPAVTVSSFDPTAVAAVRELAPHIPVGLGCAEMFAPHAVIDAAAGAGYDEVHPADVVVTPEVIEHATRAGVRLVVWTVNDRERAAMLRAHGVAGVFSDDPRLLRG